MPSPFPGMDPYLENTDFWQGFHNGFMHYAQEMLQPRLPKGYNATLEMRVYFEPDPSGGVGGNKGFRTFRYSAPNRSRSAAQAGGLKRG